MSIGGEVWPGRPFPLGATYDGQGVNFALFSEGATGVELCLFDPTQPQRESARVALTEVDQHVWHAFVPGLKPGALYGYRVKGPWDPKKGLRFNPHKLLVDPYAKAVSGKANWRYPLLAYKKGPKDPDLVQDEQDSALGVPRSVVVRSEVDANAVPRPKTPWHRTVIYELHVKGFTMLHPKVPPELRGTYAGLAHPAVIEHLQRLGVTAVELLPVHECLDETFLTDKKLVNYWGYSTLSFFAPDQRFSSRGSQGGQVDEFKQMVKSFHAAGIEVLLDVVYNHTCEGNHLGPNLCFKGVDNRTYYNLKPDDPRYYLDFTGVGNSFNVAHPQALQLILDSLRYWGGEMGVDGFRFDLATTLGREHKDYSPDAAFFRIVHQDPLLSQLKLVAEPWDVGEGGYQLGNFPVRWAEWNGKYRDTVRKYWKGDEGQAAELGYRLTGSSDLFQLSGRKPSASVNFVISHDGFTLHDLVTYNLKHNEANGEQGRDGANDNHAWNCGVEGETQDPAIIALREQQKRNFLATLFLSQGTPMLCAGDEMGRTQRGNNNAYCQDNELSWVNWELDARQQALLEFTAQMAALRRDQPVLRRRRFFQGAHIWDSAFKDLAWFLPDGKEMTKEDWQKPAVRALQYLLGGDAIPSPDDYGNRVVGDVMLILLNADHQPVPFTLPAMKWGADWAVVVDTAHVAESGRGTTPAGGKLLVAARSLVALRHPAKG